MKSLKTTAGILVATILVTPAIAPAATTADLQPAYIILLQQIVQSQQQLIATLQAAAVQLQAQVNSLTGNSTYSQVWQLQQALGATGMPEASAVQVTDSTPLPTKATAKSTPTGRSCVIQRRCGNLVVPNGAGVSVGGGPVSVRSLCSNGTLIPGGTCNYDGPCEYRTRCPGDSMAQ